MQQSAPANPLKGCTCCRWAARECVQAFLLAETCMVETATRTSLFLLHSHDMQGVCIVLVMPVVMPLVQCACPQAVLTNTMEQVVAFSGIRLLWALTMPPHLAGILPVTAVLFVIGRQLFLVGYPAGATGRAFGFALSFQPHCILTAWLLGHLAGWV